MVQISEKDTQSCYDVHVELFFPSAVTNFGHSSNLILKKKMDHPR